jgi:formylglycine-generating enzyme required for sulfatase activity
MDDPSIPRITRGGSWVREARGIRSADRVFNPTDLRRRDIGFRFILRPRT